MNHSDQEQKQTVLIVDDAEETIAMIRDLLKDLYRVKVATNGKDALRIAFSGEPPDLILLDIMMPEMDGYEVCGILKGDSQTADIPIIFLTALMDEENELKGLNMGAVDYITKPISPPVVLARVRTHLKMRRMTQYLKEKLEREDLW